MKLRGMAVALVAAALTIAVATPVSAAAADNTNSPEYWEIAISNTLGGAEVHCYKDSHGSVTADGKSVVLDTFQESWFGTGYAALIVKAGSGGEDGNGNKVYMFPNAGTPYLTPLNAGGQQADVSHWIVCKGAMPVTYDVACDAVTVQYPQGIDSIDVNIRWTALPGGATSTQNYHPNTGAADGTTLRVELEATGYYSVDWVQVNGTNYHWQEGLVCGQPDTPQPPRPADKVTETPWVDGQFACDDVSVTQTRTVTTTPYVWDGEQWVLDTENATTEQQTGSRALGEDEYYTCPVDNPQPPRPDAKVVEGDWADGTWYCDDTSVTMTRTVTTTPYIWDGDAWVLDTANAQTSVEALLRDLLPSEVFACGSDEEPDVTEPDLDGTVVGAMCDPNAPYLAYTIEVNDPDGVITATTATLTFHHPTDASQDWTMEVALGSGTAFWPGVTVDGDGAAITWPGWRWDVASLTWVEDEDVNYGWTRQPDTSVEIKVDPLVKLLTVTYPSAGPDCAIQPTIVVVSDNVAETPPTVPPLSSTGVAPTKAAAAVPVKAAASYAG